MKLIKLHILKLKDNYQMTDSLKNNHLAFHFYEVFSFRLLKTSQITLKMREQDIKYIFENRDINNRGYYCPMMPNSSCTIPVKTITAKKKTLFEKPAIFRIT